MHTTAQHEPRATPFHLALPVDDLDAARGFYGGVLGCREARSADTWVDFDLYGHQLSLHLAAGAGTVAHNDVDGDAVPIPHFGAVLDMPAWRALAERLRASGVAFILEPHVRFEGRPGEQATLFVRDPAGNALEFKGFADMSALFSA